jgi:acyl-coenzyme A synthetase/AMP-(fatty) acid ligase
MRTYRELFRTPEIAPLFAAVRQAWLAQRTAAYKRPADIITVQELPRTPSGKLLRRALRESC